jgi:excisionase family DNA binding protein
MERLMKINEVSEWLQISPKTIYNWVHYGYIPHFKVYGQRRARKSSVRFRQSDIERWLGRRKQEGRDQMKQNMVFDR